MRTCYYLILPCKKTTCTYQVRAHVSLEADLLSQRKLLVLQSSYVLDFVDHLLVASPLEPVRQEGFHELIQDLTGDQQGGQTLDRDRTKERRKTRETRLSEGKPGKKRWKEQLIK